MFLESGLFIKFKSLSKRVYKEVKFKNVLPFFLIFLKTSYFTPRVSLLLVTDRPYYLHALGQHSAFILIFSVCTSSIFVVIRKQKTKTLSSVDYIFWLTIVSCNIKSITCYVKGRA